MDSRRNLTWSLLISFLSAVAISIAGVVFAGITQAKNNEELRQQNAELVRQERENNRQWCELLNPLDSAYSSQVPSTALGKQVADAIHRIHDNFEC